MNKPIYLILGGLLVVAAALALAFWPDQTEPTPPPPPPAAEHAPARPAEEAVAPRTMVKPSFDVVRISPEGDAVIAGRATPMAEVAILDGGEELGRVIADKRGEWVFVPTTPLKPGDRELSLKAYNPDGSVLSSDDVVVLSVPATKGPLLAVKVGKDGKTNLVFQGAGDGPLTIDSVDVDDQGRIALTGRAKDAAQVRLYLDNVFLGETQPDDEGRWRLSPEGKVSKETHTLRADALDAKGKVIARVEAEFVPGEPLKDAHDTLIVVRPGTSLWRIARRLYGTGFAYTYIYEANKDQIRDPDMIYPGQMFALPTPRKQP